MSVLKSLKMIFTASTVVVSVMAVISTYLCMIYGVYIEFPLTLIGVAVIFPIVFSIGGAYTRREKALNYYADLKAHGRSIYYLTRDFTPKQKKVHREELKDILSQLLLGCSQLLNTSIENSAKMEKVIYSTFSSLSKYLKGCIDRGLPSGYGSRLNQYLSKMAYSFENLKHIYQYRTPVTLRAYSKVFIVVLPILYGPYFAFLGEDVAFPLMYIMPILFSVILVCLDNIQDHLENPFDLVGEDDVRINVEKFMASLDR
jgi:hypothetical protein